MDKHALRLEFEHFLIEEAWLLDHDQFEEWLDLFDENTRYWAPVRENLDRGDEAMDLPHLLTHFDDNKMTLNFRVKRLRTGNAHAEEPPSRTRHFVSNVRILDEDGDSSDWIELHNDGPGDVDLEDWSALRDVMEGER